MLREVSDSCQVVSSLGGLSCQVVSSLGGLSFQVVSCLGGAVLLSIPCQVVSCLSGAVFLMILWCVTGCVTLGGGVSRVGRVWMGRVARVITTLVGRVSCLGGGDPVARGGLVLSSVHPGPRGGSV